MRKTFVVLSFLFFGQPLSAEEGATSLLTDAVKQEIAERAKAEAMEREVRREKERLARYKQEIERQAAAIRRLGEQARSQQQKWSAQLQALSRENSALQGREVELKRQLAETENQAAAREAEALKTRTELETLRQKLVDSNRSLEERRKLALSRIEEDRAATSKHLEEIKKLQDELAKADMDRFELERRAAVTRAEATAMEKKLKDMALENGGKPESPEPVAVRRVATATPGARAWRLTKLCNLYEKADPNSAKLAKISKGTTVQVVAESSDFFKSEFKGQEGFIRKLCGEFNN